MEVNRKIKGVRNANRTNRLHFHDFNSMPFLSNENRNRSKGIVNITLNFFLTFSLAVFILGILVHTVKAKPPDDIVKGAVWRYFKVTGERPFKWNHLGFDDLDWFVGPSGFGYGKGSINGKVVVNADGTITYTPNPGFTGTDKFTYTVANSNGITSKSAKVVVKVRKDGKPSSDTSSKGTSGDTNVITNKTDEVVSKDGSSSIKAISDKATTAVGTPVTINVTANDKVSGSAIDLATVTIIGDFDTELDDMKGNYQTIFARKEFFVDDLSEIKGMKLSIDCDGPFIIYANGIEVMRNKFLVDEQLDISGFAHEIIPGPNVLAIECHNDDIDSDNFSFNTTMDFETVQ